MSKMSLGPSLDDPMLDVSSTSSSTGSPSLRSADCAHANRRHRVLLLLLVLTAAAAIGCAIGLGLVASKNPSGSSSSSSSSQEAVIPHTWLRMFALSDVHLDILFNAEASAFGKPPCQNVSARQTFPNSAPFGRVGCDTPQILFESALASMVAQDRKSEADVILVTGDKSGHNLYNSASGGSFHGAMVLRAQAKFTETLQKYFPHRRHILTMGNNDVPYHWQLPDASWYRNLSVYWAPLILCPTCERGRFTTRIDETEFNATFLRGGYYKIQVSEGLVMVIVNSLYWSSYAWSQTVPFRSDVPEIANEQMQWLGDVLQQVKAARQKAVIVGHVPPGLDPYRPKLDNVGLVRQFWFDNYTQIFLKTVGDTFRDTVVCNFFAHLHKDEFHVQSYNSDDSTRTPTVLLSSISPVYENNPAYRMMYFNPADWHLADYTQYWTDLVLDNTRQSAGALWFKQYTFSEEYPGPQRIDSARLQALWRDMLSTEDPSVWRTFMRNRQVYAANTLNSYARDHLYCVAYSANTTAYADCRKRHPYEPKS